MSVGVKMAVARARAYLVSIFPVSGYVELEEVEHDPDSDDPGWRITFSYDRDRPDPSERVYKVVSVTSDGTPESVTTRASDWQ